MVIGTTLTLRPPPPPDAHPLSAYSAYSSTEPKAKK